ncbi:putative uncharacterized protein YHR217C [Penaeus monodon]|uniref:putative uncharacterized protein YHR217C n=1 Tax=Penaeus monodon TaxID=6687 RepID=UPI0018A7A37C|nr:putative uncharacterized protein YHR217C [Penaeus monodon]
MNVYYSHLPQPHTPAPATTTCFIHIHLPSSTSTCLIHTHSYPDSYLPPPSTPKSLIPSTFPRHTHLPHPHPAGTFHIHLALSITTCLNHNQFSSSTCLSHTHLPHPPPSPRLRISIPFKKPLSLECIVLSPAAHNPW